MICNACALVVELIPDSYRAASSTGLLFPTSLVAHATDGSSSHDSSSPPSLGTSRGSASLGRHGSLTGIPTLSGPCVTPSSMKWAPTYTQFRGRAIGGQPPIRHVTLSSTAGTVYWVRRGGHMSLFLVLISVLRARLPAFCSAACLPSQSCQVL